MDVDIFDLENSENTKSKAQQKRKWANSRRKKQKINQRPVNNQKEKAKEEKLNSESLTYNDLIAKYL